MGKILLLLIFSASVVCNAQKQIITVDDLLTLSSLSPKSTDSYMNKKGFVAAGRSLQNDLVTATFVENPKKKSKDTLNIIRRVNLYKKDDIEYYDLHTSSAQEYQDGKNRLKKVGFLCDSSKSNSMVAPAMFQKRNFKVIADLAVEDSITEYTFSLQKKALPNPDSIRYAEDLLRFDSHEYLLSFFGQQNVKQDVYYFSEKDLKKCSVLFPNTNQQVTFIWNDEATMSNLSYILVSGILPTLSAVQYSGNISQNKWGLKNGIYSNMNIRELLELNGEDFEFYGRNSEFSYMINPDNSGKIDFKKIGLTLGCFDCGRSALLDKVKISAVDALNNSLTLYVVYITIKPDIK